MISINSYNPAVYNKNKELKRKDELRFDGYGSVTIEPRNFYKDIICAKTRTPDSEYCLEFLLDKINNKKLTGFIKDLYNNKNNLYTKPLTKDEREIKKELIRQKIIRQDGTIVKKERTKEIDASVFRKILYNIKLQKTKQELINLRIIDQDGNITGLSNKIIIKDGKDKLPNLKMPDTNIEIQGGKFDKTDYIEGDHVIFDENVNFPGTVKANRLDMFSTNVNNIEEADRIYADNSTINNIGKTYSIHANNSTINNVEKASLVELLDSKILKGDKVSVLISYGITVVKNLKEINILKLFNKAEATDITANKIIAFESAKLDKFKCVYYEKFSGEINDKNHIITKDYPMLRTDYFDKKVDKSKAENVELKHNNC